MQGGEGGVTAQIHLDRGGEPPQRPTVAHATHESRLRHAEFERDLLKLPVRHRTFQQDHDRRIAALRIANERVDPPQSMAEGHIERIHP